MRALDSTTLSLRDLKSLKDTRDDQRASWDAPHSGQPVTVSSEELFIHLDIKCLRVEGPASYSKPWIQNDLETSSRVNKNKPFSSLSRAPHSREEGKERESDAAFSPAKERLQQHFLWAAVRSAGRLFSGNRLNVSVWKVPQSD